MLTVYGNGSIYIHRLRLLGLAEMAVVYIDHFSLVDTTGKLIHNVQYRLSYLVSTQFVVINLSSLRYLYVLPGNTHNHLVPQVLQDYRHPILVIILLVQGSL